MAAAVASSRLRTTQSITRFARVNGSSGGVAAGAVLGGGSTIGWLGAEAAEPGSTDAGCERVSAGRVAEGVAAGPFAAASPRRALLGADPFCCDRRGRGVSTGGGAAEGD